MQAGAVHQSARGEGARGLWAITHILPTHLGQDHPRRCSLVGGEKGAVEGAQLVRQQAASRRCVRVGAVKSCRADARARAA